MAPRDIDVLTGQRDALLADLAGLGDLRPGTLQPRYRKCGKPTCHCAREGDPGHGLKWVLVSRIAGRTRNWTIPDEAVQRMREQLDACRRFRGLTRELIAVGDELCRARLEADLPGASGKRGRSGPAFEERVATALDAEASRLLGGGVPDGVGFERLERESRRIALEAMARALAARLNADRSDERGARLPCPHRDEPGHGGGAGRYAGRRAKTFVTALGGMELERGSYHCDACGRGFAPRGPKATPVS